MNSPNLLLHIDILHDIQPSISLLNRRPIIPRGSLLPPRQLLFAHRLASRTIEEVTSLTGKTLEIVGHVLGGEISCGVAGVGFRLLLFPAGVEEFN
jgi:hypothetical protein